MPMKRNTRQRTSVQRQKPVCQRWSSLMSTIPRNMKMMVSLVELWERASRSVRYTGRSDIGTHPTCVQLYSAHTYLLLSDEGC